MRVSRIQNEKKSKFKKQLRICYLMIGSIVIPFTLTSCSFDLNKPPAVKKTATSASGNSAADYYVVDKGSISTTLSGNGQIVPTKTTSLYFTNVSGPLYKLNFNLNDQVKKGDLFAEILPSDIQNRIDLQKIVVEKGRLKLSQMDDSQIEDLRKSIELVQLELVSFLQQQDNQPIKNETALKKAQIALEQFRSQMNSTQSAKQIADMDLTTMQKLQGKVQQQDEGSIQKFKLRLEQIDNDIISTKAAIASEQLVYDKLVGSNKVIETDNNSLMFEVGEGFFFSPSDIAVKEIKASKTKLEQLKLSLSNNEKSRSMTEVDLKLALAAQTQPELKTDEDNLNKAKLRGEQANNDLNNIQNSIDAAQLSLNEIAKSNVEKVVQTSQEIQKTKTKLEQLKLQLETAQKNNENNRRQAELDQKIAELTLASLEQNLENSKLISPISGVVSYIDKISVTDIVSSNKLLAKVADPDKLVVQLTAVDAKYITGVKNAILTIGTEKYEVDLYTPQPGDQLDQGNNIKAADNKVSNLFVTFKNKVPTLNFDEIVQARLDVKKNDVLLVPKTDLRVENGKITVDVLRDKDVATVEVARGIESDTQIEVVSGLNPGDKIIQR